MGYAKLLFAYKNWRFYGSKLIFSQHNKFGAKSVFPSTYGKKVASKSVIF